MEHENLICPICRKYTFEEYADYDICPTCGWENDGVQFDDHNNAGGANHLSVNEARIEFFLLNRVETKDMATQYMEQFNADFARIFREYSGIDHVKEPIRSQEMSGRFKSIRKDYMNKLNKLLLGILYKGSEKIEC